MHGSSADNTGSSETPADKRRGHCRTTLFHKKFCTCRQTWHTGPQCRPTFSTDNKRR